MIAAEPLAAEQNGIPSELHAHRVQVMVGDAPVWVGRLSIEQLLGLSRIFAKVAAVTDIGKLQAVAAAAKARKARKSGGAPDNTDWSALLAMLSDENVGSLLSIVCAKPAPWCLSNVDLGSLGLIVEAVIDHNEVDTLKRVFTKLGLAGSPATSPDSSTAPRS